MEMMGDFIYTEAKPLPVILLLDTSGSMSRDDNIGTLNRAVREMLMDFKDAANSEASISVAIIVFGHKTGVYMPLTDIRDVDVESISMTADGMTPLGLALDITKKMIEDKTQIPSRAYRPTVVLVSDGDPNDEWQGPLDRFMNEGRSAKCYRMAMGIGSGNQGRYYDILRSFVSNGEYVFSASDANGISKFFQYVSMSTTGRATSANPNMIPKAASVLKLVSGEAGAAVSEETQSDDIPGDLFAF